MKSNSLSVSFTAVDHPAPSNAIEIDAGLALPVAFGGLRRIIDAFDGFSPGLRAKAAEGASAEWARLVPGSATGAHDLSDTALSPSERRLHRESEQTFRVLNAAARYVVSSLQNVSRPVVIRNAGACDLVSLRGLMRAVEWARLAGVGGEVIFSGINQRRLLSPDLLEPRRQAMIKLIGERMRAVVPEMISSRPAARPLEAAVDLESKFLTEVVNSDSSAERRMAAAVLAIRSCFFSTNYEGAMLAAETGLRILDQANDQVDRAALEREWDSLDDALVTSAIEVDKNSLGGGPELRALFHRSIGVVQAFIGEFELALASFEEGLSRPVSVEHVAHLRMFRALTLIKRMGNGEKARAELKGALEGLKGRTSPSAALHEGWLRNVMALTWFQEKKLELAVDEEKAAIGCVGDLHDASATHLKINLISNLSVVQETAKRYDDSIATWRRFEKISSNWGDSFYKHHRYRLGGLLLAKGDLDQAVDSYGQAYAAASRLGDDYHQQVMTSELGCLMIERGSRAAAQEWFAKAVSHARAIGCPHRVGESLGGQILADGGTSFAPAIEALAAGSSYPAQQQSLSNVFSTSQAEAIQKALPRPKSKLNRPFDVINLY